MSEVLSERDGAIPTLTLMASADLREGFDALLQKRPPDFQGR